MHMVAMGVGMGMVVLAVLCLEGTTALAEPGSRQDVRTFAELKQIKKFVSVEVQTQGTAEKIGLKSSELTDMTRLVFLKNFPGVALEVSGGPSTAETEHLSQLGFLTCEVWTVGEEYMVAYHVDCNAGSYLMPRTPGTLWNRAILGYGPRDGISEPIRKGLQNMVQQFAATFLKVRGDGRPQ